MTTAEAHTSSREPVGTMFVLMSESISMSQSGMVLSVHLDPAGWRYLFGVTSPEVRRAWRMYGQRRNHR
jgi:hypothetical protein